MTEYPSKIFSLDVHVGEDDVIYLTMAGNLTTDNMPRLLIWAEEVRNAMVQVSARHPGHVLTLIDVRGVAEFDSESVEILRQLMAHNKNYATRTAVFGAPYFTKIIVELMLVATHRDNMKLFETREEGVAWLNEA